MVSERAQAPNGLLLRRADAAEADRAGAGRAERLGRTRDVELDGQRLAADGALTGIGGRRLAAVWVEHALFLIGGLPNVISRAPGQFPTIRLALDGTYSTRHQDV
jgi:hypothetical protein